MAKKTVKEENWLLQKENGLCGLPVAKEKKIHTFCEGYKSFLNAAKTERECVREAVKLAERAGRAILDMYENMGVSEQKAFDIGEIYRDVLSSIGELEDLKNGDGE